MVLGEYFQNMSNFNFADYFFEFIEKNGVKMKEEPKTLEEFLKEMEEFHKQRVASGWVWKPCAWYNVDGDCLHVCWSDEADYVEDLEGQKKSPEGWYYMSMGLHRSHDKNEPVAVTVYSIKHLLKEAGFKIVPIEENEQNKDI